MAAPPPLRKNRGWPLHAPSLICPEGMGGRGEGEVCTQATRDVVSLTLIYFLSWRKIKSTYSNWKVMLSGVASRFLDQEKNVERHKGN